METDKTKKTQAQEKFEINIIEARNDHDKACDLYREYVGDAETEKERNERIRAFRCGGY